MDVTTNAVNLWKAKAYIVEKLKDSLLESELFDGISVRFPIDNNEWCLYTNVFLENLHGVLSVSRSAGDPDVYHITYSIVDELDGTVYPLVGEAKSYEEILGYFRKLLDANQTEHDLELLKSIAKSIPRLKELIL